MKTFRVLALLAALSGGGLAWAVSPADPATTDAGSTAVRRSGLKQPGGDPLLGQPAAPSQPKAVVQPLPPIYTPPAPLPIGGSSASSQLWPWFNADAPGQTLAGPDRISQPSPPPAAAAAYVPSAAPVGGVPPVTAGQQGPQAGGNLLPQTGTPYNLPATSPFSPAVMTPSTANLYLSDPAQPFVLPPAQTQSAPQYQSAAAPTATFQKPFTGYRPPAAVSPYMNLYRSNSEPGFNNYYSYVRPEIEQESFNRQMQSETRQIESAVHGSMYNNTRMFYGVPGPPGGYYMNHQRFYPGLAR